VFSGRGPGKKPGNGARFGVIFLWGSGPLETMDAPAGDRRKYGLRRGREGIERGTLIGAFVPCHAG